MARESILMDRGSQGRASRLSLMSPESQSSNSTTPVRSLYTAPTTFTSPFLTSPDEDGIQALEPLNAHRDVGLDGVFELVARLASHRGGGRPDDLDEVADGPGQSIIGVDVSHGGLDRAAGLVAQHHDEPGAQLGDGELDAPLDEGARSADHVPRHADHEQVADALIEDQLGRHPRVGTARR